MIKLLLLCRQYLLVDIRTDTSQEGIMQQEHDPIRAAEAPVSDQAETETHQKRFVMFVSPYLLLDCSNSGLMRRLTACS